MPTDDADFDAWREEHFAGEESDTPMSEGAQRAADAIDRRAREEFEKARTETNEPDSSDLP
jgi:hypothetical protein